MTKPNVIFIVLDQLRPDRLQYFDEFSALKQRGVFFSKMITYAPYTVGSLHALVSGMYGTHNGVDSYYGCLDFDADHCITLAQYLKESGYCTYADVLSGIIIPHQGFDEVNVHDEYKDDLVSRHARLIERSIKDAPFFLLLHYSKIHTGIIDQVVNQYTDFDEKYFNHTEENTKRYDGFVKGAASYIAGVMGLCGNLGLDENTLFVILTDHGCSLGERPGEKCYGVFTYDYTVTTFACLLYPPALPRNTEIGLQIRSIDIMPTVLDMLGIRVKSGFKPVQGISLMPMISGSDRAERDAFVETAGLSGPFPSPYKPNICAYRTPSWKLIHNAANNTYELYDLKHDPGERTNVFGRHKDIQTDLQAKMRQQGSRVFAQD
ncbi:MAG TPA: sulfatase-like hydrolase/transferase [Candidatus Omnitrophota bacterium]|nr:sulfatase-like hydrolase/transferase [Candidatus Omnitrophota bacterium]